MDMQRVTQAVIADGPVTAAGIASSTAATLPEQLEICCRNLNGRRRRSGVVRPWPTRPYCPKCGGTEPGVIYERSDGVDAQRAEQ